MGKVGGPRLNAPEVCVFVIWSTARPWSDAILADLQKRFVIADVVELTWSRERFAHHLTRFYGTALPPDSDKERQCGTDPFLVVVALDLHPRYGIRRTTRGFRRVNVRAAAAKRRYRRLAGGGFAVHGSLDCGEARRDLRLLLGCGPEEMLDRRWDGTVRTLTVGALEWSSTDELIGAIASATPATLETDDGLTVVVQTDDPWWAAVIAGGDAPEPYTREAQLEIPINGQMRTLRLTMR
jgi:hypothetical protein